MINKHILCISDGVNLASRLEELNKRYKTSIIVSENVTSQPFVKDTFLFRPLDYVSVKGRQTGTYIYEMVDFLGNADDTLREKVEYQAQILQTFLKGDFQKCVEMINSRNHLNDDATLVIRKKAEYYTRHPPGEEWCGFEKLQAKVPNLPRSSCSSRASNQQDEM